MELKMKKIYQAVFFFSFVFNANAESFFDNSIYGVALISQNVEFEIDDNGTITSGSDSGTGLGLYIEKYYKRKFRLNGTWNYVSYDGYYITGLTTSVDYLLPVNNQVSFFGGAALGLAMQKFSDASLSESSIGLVYGAQTGVIGYINRNLMLELGYRYRPTKLETDITSTVGMTNTVNDLSETYLNVILKF